MIEFQAQPDPAIYHRLLLEMALVGERHPGRVVRGFILFAQASLDLRTEPWHGLMERNLAAPLRCAYLTDLLQRLALAQPDRLLLGVFLPYLGRTWNACVRKPRRSIVVYKRPPCRKRPVGTV